MPALAKNYTVIAPDLRGLGDSSKPLTGYDGKTIAEDIHQLVTQLGFKTIFLVGHDWGTQVAYSYAAAHPMEVKRLAVMELTIPRFAPPGRPPLWWGIFHQTPDVPEALVQGKELIFILVLTQSSVQHIPRLLTELICWPTFKFYAIQMGAR